MVIYKYKYASFNHSQNISQKYFRMDYNSENNITLHICIFFFLIKATNTEILMYLKSLWWVFSQNKMKLF